MKKKGFTLIELLAVIVILALIVIIAVPKILDVIEKSERTAWGESAGLMAKAAELKYSEGSITNTERNEIYEFENGDFKSGSPTLTFKGDKPYSGKIVQEKGKTTLALISKNKKWCAIKNTGERIAKVYKIGKEITEENCKIGYTGSSDDNKPEEYTCPDISTYPGKDLTSTEIDSDGYYIKDGYKFNINTTSNEATIVGYTGQTGETVDLVIPKTINNVPVTNITGISANPSEPKNFKNIVLSPNLIKLDYATFSNVTAENLNLDYAINLTSANVGAINIANPLTFACNNSLIKFNTTDLIGVSAPKVVIKNLDKLESIDGFSQNKVSGSIEISNLKSLKRIENLAFTNGQQTNVVLEDLPNLTYIGYSAFSSQNKFNLKIKNLKSLTSIGYSAFNNTSIKNLSFKEMPNVESIGQYVFSDSSNYQFENLDFSDASKLTDIGTFAFGSNTVSVNLSNNANPKILNYFERYGAHSYNLSNNLNITAFAPNNQSLDVLNLNGCTNITSINLSGGGNLSNINLKDLNKLEEFECRASFPNVTKLDFTNNQNLSTLNLYSLSNLKELKLGNNSKLTSMTLYSTDNLEKIVIPENVTTLNMSSSSKLKCVEILGDSTRFDDNFKSTFGVEKSSVESKCTFN